MAKPSTTRTTRTRTTTNPSPFSEEQIAQLTALRESPDLPQVVPQAVAEIWDEVNAHISDLVMEAEISAAELEGDVLRIERAKDAKRCIMQTFKRMETDPNHPLYKLVELRNSATEAIKTGGVLIGSVKVDKIPPESALAAQIHEYKSKIGKLKSETQDFIAKKYGFTNAEEVFALIPDVDNAKKTQTSK